MTSPPSLVEIGGQPLYMTVDGPAGAPWLVFSNSLATDLHLWDTQVAVLARDWRILRYDYRGHGRSGPSVTPLCTINELRRDLLGLMDFAGVDRAHHVGVSMGSVAGASAVAEQPHRFASLTICNCRLKSSKSAASDLNMRADRATSGGMGSLVELTLKKWFGSSRLLLDEAVRNKVGAMIADTRAADFAAYAKGMQDYDAEFVVTKQLIPIAILTGSDDGEIAQYLHQLGEGLSGVSVASIEGAGHLPNIHAPNEFNTALTKFLYGARPQRS